MTIRSNQRWQKVDEETTPRHTCAEKVRRLEAAYSLGLSHLHTSPYLAAHVRARTRAYMRARARVCVCNQVWYVWRCDSRLILNHKFRHTSKEGYGLIGEVWHG